MGDEEGMEAECTLVVLSFAGANLTKLAPSLNTSSAVPEPTALFFLHACFMTTSGYANCPQPDLWMCVVFLFARLFQTCQPTSAPSKKNWNDLTLTCSLLISLVHQIKLCSFPVAYLLEKAFWINRTGLLICLGLYTLEQVIQSRNEKENDGKANEREKYSMALMSCSI